MTSFETRHVVLETVIQLTSRPLSGQYLRLIKGKLSCVAACMFRWCSYCINKVVNGCCFQITTGSRSKNFMLIFLNARQQGLFPRNQGNDYVRANSIGMFKTAQVVWNRLDLY